jgi:ATP/maltotriose-dependent transcriptional regulator MalT
MRDVSRSAELRAVGDFLGLAAADPAALVIVGEAGIGKTTVWLEGLEQARERGFQVLAARPSAADSVLAYNALADLLAGVDEAIWTGLADPQRLAIERVLLRAKPGDRATDPRAVAAAFLSIVERLATASPVLLAIDDLQWLDQSSLPVLTFAARRLSGPVGLLATHRTEPASGTGRWTSWLQLPEIDAISRITLLPFSLGGLHALISERLGRSLPRPVMVRIHEISGGNPFYALELARAAVTNKAAEPPLPSSLAELVRARLERLDPGVHDILLAAACVTAPTVDLVASATSINSQRALELLEDAEYKEIVEIDGRRLSFTHPLLARGVYSSAAPARRRTMHRRLAEIIEEPELQARHLALGGTTGDPLTLNALDGAAEVARIRGAPAAAAELIDLAIGLGGDTPSRQIRSAGYYFDAGDPGRARAVLEATIARLGAGILRAQALGLLALVCSLNDSFLEAALLLERALADTEDDLAQRVQVLVPLSFALMNSGSFDAAVLRADEAVSDATNLAQPHLLSQALIMRVMLHFLRGDGVDESSLRRAVELEDLQADISTAFSPSVHNALLLALSGHLEQGREKMLSVRRRCIDAGEEGELAFIDFHLVLIELWRGSVAEATLIAEDAMERALLLNGDLPLPVALSVRGLLFAYSGDEEDARRNIIEALAASERCGSYRLREWTVTALGFLELSLGNHEAALTALQPLLPLLEAAPNSTEIMTASFVPDAAESLIQLGRLEEAEPLIDALERNGHRLDRAWMLAVGGRCRALLLAARGDIEAASDAAQRAMKEHDRLPMPFERARTQLVLGGLQRRQRQRDAASTTFNLALQMFEDLGAPLWADRARAELARTGVGPRKSAELTPSEQRVAELAASGMTNRDVASALFISPRTVEVNLARIYRKLNIHSRAELGRRIMPANQ